MQVVEAKVFKTVCSNTITEWRGPFWEQLFTFLDEQTEVENIYYNEGSETYVIDSDAFNVVLEWLARFDVSSMTPEEIKAIESLRTTIITAQKADGYIVIG